MEYKILLPAAIWQDYNPFEGEFLSEVSEPKPAGEIIEQDYAFDAPIGGVAVRVAMRGYIPIEHKGEVALLVEEYTVPPDRDFITELCKAGVTVFVPDTSGIGNHATVFPEEYAYGKIENAGEHICKVMPTAKETCQYLYSVIVKRAIAYMDAELGIKNPVLVGLGDAVEVAIQVAGSGGAIRALAAINGSGYREYIKLNKYGGGKELDITEERMCWLSGVASVAYAKNINVPVYIAMGTNSKKCDIDRLENLVALIPTKMVHISLAIEADDCIFNDGFTTLKSWMSALYHGGIIPTAPVATLKIRDDGIPCAEVGTDATMDAKAVNVFFSYGEYNHTLRRWRIKKAVTVCKGSYICSPDAYDEKGVLFAVAVVDYGNNMVFATNEAYIELSGQPVRKSMNVKKPILFSPYSDMALLDFVEECNNIVLFKEQKRLCMKSTGVMGITTDKNTIKTYNIGNMGNITATTMQVDIMTDSEQIVEFVLEIEDKGTVRAYKAIVSTTNSQDFFLPYRLEPRDFKCAEQGFPMLASWEGAKSLGINGDGALIGNILFI